ncbi:SDR family oxidoreductase [Leptospira sp. GIMC2001]|uniref:SDR family oxidoreductase n=1 Tax=Leptospira sp. GIMC2001 TaxID=1513297 RepID=UPI00234AB3FB|nr:SDR family oxidoreductase [Leptospira sp. GIMC2001]WCL50067.1 SDR family oxidoreductase [Leptospira sp. GIMC2001]
MFRNRLNVMGRSKKGLENSRGLKPRSGHEFNPTPSQSPKSNAKFSNPSPSYNLVDKQTVAITGAGSGIGLSTALKFYNEGWALSLCDLNLDNFKTLITELKLDVRRIYFQEMDVSDRKACEKWIQATVKKFGRLDCLICNAGIAHRSRAVDTDPSIIEKIMAVNFYSVVYLCHAAIPYIQKVNGSIVGISSVAGFSPLYGRTGYVASKHALAGYLETIRSETEPNIHTCVVYPSFVKTSFDKNTLDGSGKILNRDKPLIGKPLTPESIADSIYYAVIHRKKRLLLSSIAKISYYLSRILPDVFMAIMKKKTESEFIKR